MPQHRLGGIAALTASAPERDLRRPARLSCHHPAPMPRDLTPAVRSLVGRRPRRVQRSRQVGQLARPRRAQGAEPAAGLPGQPQRHARCSGSPPTGRSTELPGHAGAGRGGGAAGRLRRGGRRLAGRRAHGPSSASPPGSASRARRAGVRETGAGRARPRRRRDPARARTASASTTRPPTSASAPTSSRPGRSASSPRAATSRSSWASWPAHTDWASRALPRLATRPTSTWPSWWHRSAPTSRPS